jgi:hypothetical protein
MRRVALGWTLLLLVVVLPTMFRPPVATAQGTGPDIAKTCDATVGLNDTIFTNYALTNNGVGIHYTVLSATDDGAPPPLTLPPPFPVATPTSTARWTPVRHGSTPARTPQAPRLVP